MNSKQRALLDEGGLHDILSWGKPVDIEVMKDGLLLISDDKAGRIYRVSYEKRTVLEIKQIGIFLHSPLHSSFKVIELEVG